LVTSVSLFVYVAGFVSAWLVMVVGLGLALKRGLVGRRAPDAGQ